MFAHYDRAPQARQPQAPVVAAQGRAPHLVVGGIFPVLAVRQLHPVLRRRQRADRPHPQQRGADGGAETQVDRRLRARQPAALAAARLVHRAGVRTDAAARPLHRRPSPAHGRGPVAAHVHELLHPQRRGRALQPDDRGFEQGGKLPERLRQPDHRQCNDRRGDVVLPAVQKPLARRARPAGCATASRTVPVDAQPRAAHERKPAAERRNVFRSHRGVHRRDAADEKFRQRTHRREPVEPRHRGTQGARLRGQHHPTLDGDGGAIHLGIHRRADLVRGRCDVSLRSHQPR